MKGIGSIVIVSPRQKWGGAIALHALCKILNRFGFESSIFYTESYYYGKTVISKTKFWIKWCIYTAKDCVNLLMGRYEDEPIKGCKRKYTPIMKRNALVLYPDVVFGNPLRAKNVVRWMLYFNRFTDKKHAYGEKDLFFCYNHDFNDWDFNPSGRKLTVSYFDLSLYKQSNFGMRRGTCYIIRKGQTRSDLPESFNGVIIDDLPEKKKVEIFNKVEKCISYDTRTAYSGIASLCGCLSIVVPEEGKDISYYRNENTPRYGVAIGFSENEAQYARDTRDQLIKSYNNSEQRSLESVNKFIKECFEYFGNMNA